MAIVSTLQTLLNDTGVFWPTDQLLDAVNEAQVCAMARTRWQRTSAVLTLNTGDDIIAIPPTIMIPEWVDDGSVRIYPTTQRELEHYMRGWRGQGVAAPTNFALWDATHLRAFPRPDQTYNTYTIWGVAWPSEFTSSTDVLSGADLYQTLVTFYAMSLLLEATRPDLADYYYKLAMEKLLAYNRQIRNTQSHNIRHLRPQSTMSNRMSGVVRNDPVAKPIFI